MNVSMMPVFEQKLKTIKKRIKKHIHDSPKDKIKKDVVSNLLKDANRLKKIIIQYRKENQRENKKEKPEQVVICPHCSKEFTINNTTHVHQLGSG